MTATERPLDLAAPTDTVVDRRVIPRARAIALAWLDLGPGVAALSNRSGRPLARRRLGVTEGNPQDLYFQPAYELARTFGSPDDFAGTGDAESIAAEALGGPARGSGIDRLGDPERECASFAAVSSANDAAAGAEWTLAQRGAADAADAAVSSARRRAAARDRLRRAAEGDPASLLAERAAALGPGGGSEAR